MDQLVLRRRASDKPWQWAVLFTLFAIFTLPFYCITRRSWRPLVHVFASFASVVFTWSLIIGMIEGMFDVNYQENTIANTILYLGCLAAIYIGGYISIRSIKIGSVSILRDSPTEEALSGSSIDSPGEYILGNELFLLFFGFVKTQKKIIGIVAAVILVIAVAGYAVYTITVENMIKQNPVVAAVAATGTKVVIKHFNCEDSYGFYDSSVDTLQVCTAIHDDQLFSSKESTIRHEAWHLVQACSAVKSKEDEWGNFDLVNTPLLAGKTLTHDEEKYIVDNYEEIDHSIETEALLAELHLTDGQIIQAIEGKCYFPE